MKAKQVSVSATGFSPSEVTIKVGDTVKFTNTDAAPHNVRFVPAPVPPKPEFHPADLGVGGASAQPPSPPPVPLKELPVSPDLAKDGTFEQTFDTAGTYFYRDDMHPEFTGSVVVS